MSFSNINNTTGLGLLGPDLPATSFYLLDPFQNYLAYQHQFHKAPGIPFLLPHVREFKQHGESILR